MFSPKNFAFFDIKCERDTEKFAQSPRSAQAFGQIVYVPTFNVKEPNFALQLLPITGLLLLVTFMVQAQEEGPLNPEFGKCYALCSVPNGYEVINEQVMVKPESKKFKTIPAQFETKTEQIRVKEAYTKIIPIPAVFEIRTETIEVRPASTKLVEVPDSFVTITERIQIAPETGKWEKKEIYGEKQITTNCLEQKINPEDCHIMHWVKIPAQYKTYTKKVLQKSTAPAQLIEIPAEYKTISLEVLKTPASYKVEEVPAEYRTVTKKVLVSGHGPYDTSIPAVYKSVPKLQLIDPNEKANAEEIAPSIYWEEVICDTQIDADLIREVQMILKYEGYYNGKITGFQGEKTNAALEKYQQEKGLPVKHLNIKTLDALGIYR